MVDGRSKNKARSAPVKPEQQQDMDLHEEGDESGTEDHQEEQVSAVSLQKCNGVSYDIVSFLIPT